MHQSGVGSPHYNSITECESDWLTEPRQVGSVENHNLVTSLRSVPLVHAIHKWKHFHGAKTSWPLHFHYPGIQRSVCDSASSLFQGLTKGSHIETWGRSADPTIVEGTAGRREEGQVRGNWNHPGRGKATEEANTYPVGLGLHATSWRIRSRISYNYHREVVRIKGNARR